MNNGCFYPRLRSRWQRWARRARRSRRGELIQIDGSEHDWLEGRGERMCLVSFIDDATSETVVARFMPHETTSGYMKLMKEYIGKKGCQEHFIVTNIAYSDKTKKKDISKEI